MLYPVTFRRRYSEEMRRDFRELMREGLEEGGARELVRVWAEAHSDLVLTALEERGTLLARRYAAYSSVDPRIAKRAAARAMVVTVFVAVGVSWASYLQPPTYESSVLIQVGDNTTGDTNSALDVADLQELTLTVAKAVPTTPVAEAVVERLEDPPEGGAGAVIANTSAEPDPGTVFVNVSYEDTDPMRAQLIANTVGEVSSELISERSTVGSNITATVWEEASLPLTPVSPHPLRNGLLTLVIGLVLCAGTLVALPGVGARVAGTLGEWSSRQGVGQARVLSRRHSDYSIVERVKEKKLLLALGRRGKLTALRAAVDTSLSPEESRRILEELAFAGHLEITFEDGKLVYSFWGRD